MPKEKRHTNMKTMSCYIDETLAQEILAQEGQSSGEKLENYIDNLKNQIQKQKEALEKKGVAEQEQDMIDNGIKIIQKKEEMEQKIKEIAIKKNEIVELKKQLDLAKIEKEQLEKTQLELNKKTRFEQDRQWQILDKMWSEQDPEKIKTYNYGDDINMLLEDLAERYNTSKEEIITTLYKKIPVAEENIEEKK